MALGKKLSMARSKLSLHVHRQGKISSKGKRPIYVDSGATITSIGEDLYGALDSGYTLKKRTQEIQTAKGVHEVPILENVMLCLDRDTCYKGPMAVMPNTIGDVLIGTDFMLTNKCRIDFDKKTFQCGKKKFTFKLEG